MRFTGKYNCHKIHTKLHPGSESHTSHIFTCENTKTPFPDFLWLFVHKFNLPMK